ncbi:hypothetical protein RQP46_002869 [Phenoliferia psychrophenolica]
MFAIRSLLVVSALLSAVAANPKQLPVNLGTAANFAILAERGISTDPSSAITGNIGVTPSEASYITGFSLDQVTGNNYSSSSQVTGRVYAANYINPTPFNLRIANGDSNTAYVDAMGRSNPDYFNLMGGNIGGLRINAGLYKWTTDVYINNIVRLVGTDTDQFIFQISGVLTVASAVHVVLLGGVKPENIFWAVTGGCAMGTSSVMQGVVSSQTKIFMDTKSSITGRIFAQSAVSIYQATITEPSS